MATFVTTPAAEASGQLMVRGEPGRVRIGGVLSMRNAAALWRRLGDLLDGATQPSIDIDLAAVEFADGACVSLLVELRRELGERGIRAQFVGASESLEKLIHVYGGYGAPQPRPSSSGEGAIEKLGGKTQRMGQSLGRWVAFVGALVASIAGMAAKPATANLRAIVPLAERAGADGAPIVLLLNFLVGFVMGYQSAHQLALYGANVYVADVVGISVTRELAPLMTAIIMSGRSGAAFAAELGTMKVSEELDALRTLGLEPIRYLVLPRVIALALVAPLLTLIGAVVGVFGGAVVGVVSLDVGFRGYVAELRTAVFFADVWTGLAKSVAFGIAIALIGCQQGFATRGGAEAVGRRTTATVVICLFVIVILDTLFTLAFRTFGV